MNSLIDWITRRVSRLLSPADRVVAQGDLAELNVTGWRALREIFCLVVLRQAELWKTWRPWLALIGVACIAGAVLSRLVFAIDVVIGTNIRAYWHYRVFMNDATLGEVVLQISGLLLITSACSWIAGFALARLSGRAVWLTGPMLYLVVMEAFPAWLRYTGSLRSGPSPIPMILAGLLNAPGVVVFLLPAITGLRRGLRRSFL